MNTPLEIAINRFPSLSAFAEAVGVKSYAVVQQWRKNGVPIKYCVAVETASGGIVTRRDLRPDDWHMIWPELANEKAA